MTITLAGSSLLASTLMPTPHGAAHDLWQLVDEPSVLELGGAANGERERAREPSAPEQLHPGVYLAAVPFEAHPIDGVPTSPIDPEAHVRSSRWRFGPA